VQSQSRRPERRDPQGHYSAAFCHLANISYRLGTEVPFNKPAKAFGDNKEAAETLARMEEHLKDNGAALDGLDYRLSRKLTFDTLNRSKATLRPTAY